MILNQIENYKKKLVICVPYRNREKHYKIFFSHIKNYFAYDKLDKYLNKSTAIALSYDDPTSPAKVIKDFTKENDLPEVKGIVFEGEVLDGSEFKRFANVPSKEESLAKMIALLRSPLTKVAFALKSPMTSFGNVLNNLKENKSN